ncbi:hypothetical protein DCAR_0830722 [Daucus carota subsp. sativus]|uniref:Uncharacterized protein n=1 Tax=Daucus carota subsp. sativus TaxID=79200 RepID=A0AAF1BBR1_DAUCS|nr:hypothetical protein DCAR_0830722 [Daucus carota subsp. sativus]
MSTRHRDNELAHSEIGCSYSRCSWTKGKCQCYFLSHVRV